MELLRIECLLQPALRKEDHGLVLGSTWLEGRALGLSQVLSSFRGISLKVVHVPTIESSQGAAHCAMCFLCITSLQHPCKIEIMSPFKMSKLRL